MSIHPDGTGTGWTNVEAVDVDQPHGKDYLYSQHIAKGVRKRMSQEHVAFADSTVGGIHKPGGAAVLGECDGTPGAADGTYRGHGIVWDLSSRLWCSTAAAGASTSGDFTVITLHPDKQWKGGDVTWAGAHEFDASVDISGNVALDGDFSVDGTAAFTDASFDGTVDFGDGVAFGAEVSIGGALIVDGTAVFTSNVDISGSLDVSGTFNVLDASGNPFAVAWACFCGNDGITLLDGFNITPTRAGVGDYSCTFTNALPSANYVVVGTINDSSTAALAVSFGCISQKTTGFRVVTKQDGVGLIDVSRFSVIVFGG